jgi:hypothetical protein
MANSRVFAGLIGLGAILTLTVQTGVDVSNGDAALQSMWSQARYFTNLMVSMVGVFFCLIAAGRIENRPGLTSAITVWIVLVGVVYHALLASTHHPEGLDVGVNLMQHTVLPIAVLLYWMGFVWKDSLTLGLPLVWLICPISYVAYVLLRGAFDQEYPYFFLNPIDIGWPGVGAYVVGLGVLFYLSGIALVFGAQRLRSA